MRAVIGRSRMLTVAGALAVAGVALAGCSSQASPSLSPPPSAAPATESSSWQIALAALQHVHEVAFGGDGLLLATHQGVYTVDLNDGALQLTGAASFDAMGMAVTDAGVLASGHPGALTDDVFVAPNVGLIADDGDGWRSISLSGEVDFHALTASPDGTVVAGLPSGETVVMHSADGGLTWQRGAALEARDLVLAGDELIATTADGPLRSTDGGMTFTALGGAPLLVLVASSPSGNLVGVDATGAIVREEEGSWTTIGQVEGAAAGIAVAADSSVAVVDDRGVVLSRDGGDVWQVLVPAR